MKILPLSLFLLIRSSNYGHVGIKEHRQRQMMIFRDFNKRIGYLTHAHAGTGTNPDSNSGENTETETNKLIRNEASELVEAVTD